MIGYVPKKLIYIVGDDQDFGIIVYGSDEYIDTPLRKVQLNPSGGVLGEDAYQQVANACRIEMVKATDVELVEKIGEDELNALPDV